jgi:hypothetical protein
MRGCGFLSVLMAVGAVAQTPEVPQASSITVQSNLVLVPTLVQDAKGKVL